MVFPHALRDAIPGNLPGCDCALALASVDGESGETRFGRRVRLHLHLEETGKLNGKFSVYVDLNLEAARALASTINDLVACIEPS
jgi:hypothetical protein